MKLKSFKINLIYMKLYSAMLQLVKSSVPIQGHGPADHTQVLFSMTPNSGISSFFALNTLASPGRMRSFTEMFSFGKILAYGRSSDRDEIAYKSVDLEADDDTRATPDKSSMVELVKVKKKLRFFRTAFYVTHAFQALFFTYWFFRGDDASHPHATYRDLEWSGLLGEDWNGIVPNGTSMPTKTQSDPQLHLPLLRYRGIRNRVSIKADLLGR